ncbi:hypothtetical protein, putative [Babesia bigemina]|uniref:Hypothtetical protein, putative n=1 Tax=Babesia bigemina TaxID=5866 RepID=A0A061D073_BABBI|nr:hypothtetical protein, putative [Babesia bigemina]CDR94068.1 hypothtetical protein, putative [Babesia bigemina]|eukprot:XP_012766254.1 hypothtetical protein, putative [Babesia bigemina]
MSDESPTTTGPVRVGQRVILGGNIATVRWRGLAPAKHCWKPSDRRSFHCVVANGEPEDAPPEETEEEQAELLGVEWDNWRVGTHNGTVDGVFYFEPERMRRCEKVMQAVQHVYSGHDEPWLRENAAAYALRTTIDNFENRSCSFVRECDVQLGVPMERAVHNRYITDDPTGESSSPHGKGRIGHEFVGRDEALEFFSHTANLLMLGLQDCRIDRLGDCTRYAFPRVREAHLPNNLISDWDVVRGLLAMLPRVDTLDLSGNMLVFNDEKPLESSTLATVVLNNTMLDFGNVARLLSTVKGLKSLSLCRNMYVELPTLEPLQSLRSLDLTENSVWNWFYVLRLVKSAPTLTRLIITKNRLSNLCVDPETGSPLSLYRAALLIGKDRPEPLKAFAALDELHMEENYVHDWQVVSDLAVVFPRLRVLRLRLCLLHKEATQAEESVHRQVLIAIFPELKVLNGTEVTKYDRINAERYYLSLEHANSTPFKSTNTHEALDEPHSSRLEEIHGKRDVPPPKEGVFVSPGLRMITVKLVPDGDSDSYLKPVVTRSIPLCTTVLELKVICCEVYGLTLSDVVLIYNSGDMPISERMDNDEAEIQYYGVDDGYSIRIQSRRLNR